jgi:hypothetical protein
MQLLKRLVVDMDEILYGVDDVEGGLNAMFFLIPLIHPFQNGGCSKL